MKILIILLMAFSCSANAKWFFPFGKNGAKKGYSDQNKCSKKENHKCYDISGKDLRKWKAGFKAIDVKNTMDCDDSADCQSKIDANNFSCTNFETSTFDDKKNWPGLDFISDSRPNIGWFLWCQKSQLVNDSVGISAAAAEDAAKLTEKTNKKTKQLSRKMDLLVCAKTKIADMTVSKQKNCIRALSREMMRQRLESKDM